MKIVVDATLFAGGLIKPESNPGTILGLVKDNKVELIVSPAIIKEIKRIVKFLSLWAEQGKSLE